ncbi:MAG: 50S ribosomal protein L25 [Tissierellia bacterium]|nr:50S ribosomal protein L25 [Tissierellia bacterium]
MSEFKLSLNKREAKGKNKVDKLRAQGIVPGVLYAKGEEALAVQGLEKDLLKIYNEAGTSNIVALDIDGEEDNILFKEVQMHPLKNQMIHFDLYEIDMTQKITVVIPIVLEGRDSIKAQPSNLIQVLDEIEVECLPAHLPSEAVVNVIDMEIGDTVSIKDLDICQDEDVVVLAELEDTVATLTEPRDEEELDALDEDVEEAEAGEVPTVSETEEDEEEQDEE